MRNICRTEASMVASIWGQIQNLATRNDLHHHLHTLRAVSAGMLYCMLGRQPTVLNVAKVHQLALVVSIITSRVTMHNMLHR